MKIPTKNQISELLQDLILGPKYLTKKRKDRIKCLLNKVDGCGSNSKKFDIIMVIGDNYIEYPITVGEPKIENLKEE